MKKYTRYHKTATLICMILLFTIFIQRAGAMVFPGADWVEMSPESQGVDSAKLNQALNYLEDHTGFDGIGEVVVIRNGYMIWKGNNIDKKHGVWSCTKAFTSTVMGLLYDDGELTPETFASDHVSSLSSQYPNVKLKHFAAMTSGYDAVGGTAWADYLDGSDTPWVPTDPMFAPEGAYLYWDDAANMLAHVLTQIAQEQISVLFRQRIADPIGMDSSSWSWGDYGTVDGYVLNGGGGNHNMVEITAREMARFGHLFLNRGNWDGNQVLSTSWVDDATQNHVLTSIPLFRDIYQGIEIPDHMDIEGRGIYGYHWWVNGITVDGSRSMPDAPVGTFYRTGHNDNYVIVVPEWDMVIVRLGVDETIDNPAPVFNNMLKLIGEGLSTTIPNKVTGFTLVNADTNQDIRALNDGDTVNLAFDGYNLNIRADTEPPTVGSVQFGLDGNPNYWTDNIAPYAFAGVYEKDLEIFSIAMGETDCTRLPALCDYDIEGNDNDIDGADLAVMATEIVDDAADDYNAWTPSIGSHTLTATPYTAAGGSGIAGPSLSISFTVTDSDSDPFITGERRAWHPVTITFKGPYANESDSSPNPFLDYRLQVVFTGPGNQVYNVPGFFDGDGNGGGSGNRWRVRFTPDAWGTWNYQASFHQGNDVAIDTSFSAGSPAGFDGVSGSFNVSGRDTNAEGFLSKGRLAYDSGFYLKTLGDGKHWIKGGTDSPENFLAYDGFDNTLSSHDYDQHVQHWNSGDPDWGGNDGRGIIGALNYLSLHNVNSIYFLPMNIGGDGRDVWPYIGTINPDGSTWNDNEHFDISKLTQWNLVFEHAQRKGIHLHFVLNEAEEPNKRELDNGGLGVERKLYYRELISRFGHHNAIQWNLCEEYDLDMPLSSNLIKSWAQYIADVDPYNHPVSVHNMDRDAWNPFFGDSRFDLTSYQYHSGSYGSRVEELASIANQAGRKIPICMDEFYSTKMTDDESHVTSYPHLSGQSFIRKNVLWPVYLSGGQVEYFLEDTLSNDDFQLYENLWQYTWYARKFMEDHLPFWEMEPMDSLLTGEALGYEEDGQVFAKPGEIYAVYLPNGNPSGELDLSAVSGSFQKSWYNPRTGRFEGSATAVSAERVISLGPPPRDPLEDWIVLLKRQDSACSNIECNIPGLVANWTMDFISSGMVMDLSGNSNNCVIHGNPLTTTGKVGDALLFDGVDDFLDCGNLQSLNEMTILTWINVYGTPLHSIVDKELQYGMKLNGDCGSEFTLEWDTENDWQGTSYTIPDSDCNRWLHVAVSMNGNTKYWYGNGQLIGTKAVSGAIDGNDNSVIVGALGPGAPEDEWFYGLIDEVLIFDRALSHAEIETIYIEGLGEDKKILNGVAY